MIGVIANPADHDVVCEFFELFKTPWEFYRGEGTTTFCSVPEMVSSTQPQS